MYLSGAALLNARRVSVKNGQKRVNRKLMWKICCAMRIEELYHLKFRRRFNQLHPCCMGLPVHLQSTRQVEKKNNTYCIQICIRFLDYDVVNLTPDWSLLTHVWVARQHICLLAKDLEL